LLDSQKSGKKDFSGSISDKSAVLSDTGVKDEQI
jgi:hypothetical protein